MAKLFGGYPQVAVADGTPLVPIRRAGANETTTLDAAVAATASGVQVALLPTTLTNNSVVDRNRANHTGLDPAANVVFTDALTLQAWRTIIETAVASAGTGDPVITTDPALTGTVGVGNALTGTAGLVTNGAGGAHNNIFTWLLTPVSGAVSVLFAETKSGTTSSFTQTAAQIGGNITMLHQAIDTVTNILSKTRTSNIKGPVTGTAPTNSVAPTMSGSAASGSAISVNVGTWAGASTYSAQLLLNGAAIGAATVAAAGTPIALGNSDDSMVGLPLTARVTAYSSLGVPSTAPGILTSNSITVTGSAPAITNTTPPTWQATINFGTQANGNTIGVWTGAIHATRSYSYYINTIGTTPDFGPQQLFVHTPRSPAVVGDTLYVVETVFDAATGLTVVGTATSAGKVISAALSAFAAALTAQGAAGYVLTQSQVMTQANPIALTGGTQPYKLDPTTPWTPALTPGLVGSVSGSSVFLNGTPTTQASILGFVANLLDSAGTPASVAAPSFNITVNPAGGATPLAIAGFPVPPDYSPFSGPNFDGATTFSAGGHVLQQAQIDPGGSGLTTYVHRIVRADWAVGPRNVRCENVWIDHTPSRTQTPGNHYWRAYAFRPIPGEWPITAGAFGDERMLINQSHSESNGDTQPPTGLFLWEDMKWRWVRSWDATVPTTGTGGANQVVPGDSLGGTSVDYVSSGNFVPGQWVKVIEHIKPGWLTSHAPMTEVWVSINHGPYVQIVSKLANTDFNDYNNINGSGGIEFPGSYPRTGFYKWATTNWNSNYATVAMNASTLYWGVGTNLYANAVAALAGL